MTCCEDKVTGTDWKFLVNRPDFRNPVQGVWNNCTFVAALTSICWVNPKFIKKLTDPPVDSYTITLHEEITGNRPAVSIKPSLCVVDHNASPLSFCGSKHNQFYTTKEVWPAMYEKAYAKFCFYKKNKTLVPYEKLSDPKFWPIDANGNFISPCSLSHEEWGGDPVTAMLRISGCSAFSNYCFTPDKEGFPKRDSPTKWNYPNPPCTCTGTTDIGNFLKTCLSSRGKTTRPTAAWTYPKEKGLNSDGVEVRYVPDGCTYSLSGIQKNHSYSILGIHEPGDGKQYIVLRNPCGVDPSDSDILAKIYTGNTAWTPDNSYYKFCTRGINPTADGPGLPGAYTISLSDQDGVFGLLASEFTNYFQGFGWLQP